MRTPKQVLVIPYLIEESVLKLCMLRLSDIDVWQWVSGGVEDGESIDHAAIRECSEELGINCQQYNILRLETQCSIPKYHFTFPEHRYDNIYTVTEYSFAIELAQRGDIILSNKHSEFQFITYNQLESIETWDSNRTAAWELRQRLLDEHKIID